MFRFFFSFVYIEDPIIKKVCDPMNRFNTARIVCLSQARICISNAKSRGLLYCIQWFEMRGKYSCCRYWWNGFFNHHCLNYLFIILQENTRRIHNEKKVLKVMVNNSNINKWKTTNLQSQIIKRYENVEKTRYIKER